MADFEVIAELTPSPFGGARFLCRPPRRFSRFETVAVSELALDASRWPQLSDVLSRISAIGAGVLLELLEIGPDLDPSGAGVYLVTETNPGGTLVAPPAPMGRTEMLSAVANAAEAAHALHQSGLTHGSIDQRSIFLTERGAVLAPPPLDLPLGAMARFMAGGSLETVDPDLICGELPTRCSDIWSLGATAHAVVSPASLYEGIRDDEPVTAVQRVLFGRPVVDPNLPGPLVELIEECLDSDPAARPGTAMEVAERLRSIGAQL